MARVTVVPETFHLVNYDNARIAEIASGIADEAGISADAEVRIEVDETNPFGRTSVLSLDPITVKVESGGFEDSKRPKAQSDRAVTETLGRLLFLVADRMKPEFADAPGEDELTNEQRIAWSAYALGRCQRLGHEIAKPRWQYHFRNRNGFNDVADAAFERLWAGDNLTWADIDAACQETERAKSPAKA